MARITVAAASVRPSTLTSPSAVSEASPSIRSIAFFLNSPPTPEVRVVTTLSRRAWMAAKSTSTPLTSNPNSFAPRISDSRSAERRTAFAGMQA